MAPVLKWSENPICYENFLPMAILIGNDFEMNFKMMHFETELI